MESSVLELKGGEISTAFSLRNKVSDYLEAKELFDVKYYGWNKCIALTLEKLSYGRTTFPT